MGPREPSRPSHSDDEAHVMVDGRFASMMLAEFARLTSTIADQTAALTRNTAALEAFKQVCAITHHRVDERLDVLEEGKAEITNTHLRTVESELEARKKSSGEWTRTGVFSLVSFMLALALAWLTKR